MAGKGGISFAKTKSGIVCWLHLKSTERGISMLQRKEETDSLAHIDSNLRAAHKSGAFKLG